MNMHAIYICFDDRFFPYARACLNSLRQNYPGHPRLLVDYVGDDGDILAFLHQFDATLLDPAPLPEFSQHLTPLGDTKLVFRRFQLWRSTFADYDTILHLDADTLILKPLTALFETDTPFFVSNHEPNKDGKLFSKRHADDPLLQELLTVDGLTYPGGIDDMANAGVFSLPRSFRNRLELSRMSGLAKRYGRYFAYADQSLLSLWLRVMGLKPSLAFRFNFQTPFFTDPSISLPLDKVHILHFSNHKPGTDSFANWRRIGTYRAQLNTLYETYRTADSGP